MAAVGVDVNAALERLPEPGKSLRVAVVVAHPDDETLWAGGLLLSHPEWSPFIVTLCRGDDPDRAPRFRKALERLGATGIMGRLDDGPAQAPIPIKQVQDAILLLLPDGEYDLVLTHAPQGEYTWHRRHQEVALAVRELWGEGHLRARSLWQFAYEDGGGTHVPQPQQDASFLLTLPKTVWAQKYGIITEVYGFAETSWEACAATRAEAFHCFTDRRSLDPLPVADRGLNS
jgi:LmbE family N-acetylglucosaminyl deacetylase